MLRLSFGMVIITVTFERSVRVHVYLFYELWLIIWILEFQISACFFVSFDIRFVSTCTKIWNPDLDVLKYHYISNRNGLKEKHHKCFIVNFTIYFNIKHKIKINGSDYYSRPSCLFCYGEFICNMKSLLLPLIKSLRRHVDS